MIVPLYPRVRVIFSTAEDHSEEMINFDEFRCYRDIFILFFQEKLLRIYWISFSEQNITLLIFWNSLLIPAELLVTFLSKPPIVGTT